MTIKNKRGVGQRHATRLVITLLLMVSLFSTILIMIAVNNHAVHALGADVTLNLLSERDLNCQRSMDALENIIADFENPSTEYTGMDAELGMYNENYAGAYFDDAGYLNFGTVNVDFLDVGEHAGQVIHRKLKYSYNQLLSVQMAIINAAADMDISSVAINEIDNLVDVTVRNDSSAIVKFLAENYTRQEDIVRVKMKDASNQRFAKAYPAGDMFDDVATGTICANAIDNKTGKLGVLTAAHVLVEGNRARNMYTAAGYMGGGNEFLSNTKVDAGFLPFANQSLWSATATVEPGHSLSQYSTKLGKRSDIFTGQPIVKAGAESFVSYGVIINPVGYVFFDDYPDLPVKSFSATCTSEQGDSGAPVYALNIDSLSLIGMLIGGRYDENRQFVHSWSVGILDVTAQLDITIITSKNENGLQPLFWELNGAGSALITAIGTQNKNVTIPNTVGNNIDVVGIDTEAAINNKAIETVDLGNVLFLNPYAFQNATNLKTVVGAKLRFIQGYAFDGCTSLGNLSASSLLQEIGIGAFRNCTSIAEFMIGGNVNSIGNGVFIGCTNLESLYVKSGNTTYRDEGNCIIRISDNTIIAGCKTSVIPSSARSIAYGAFAGHIGLTNVTIPSNSVTNIGEYAFAQSGLINISISSSVSTIGDYAFAEATGIKSIINLRTTPQAINSTTFQGINCANIVLNVPQGTRQAYINAGWSGFNIVENITDSLITSTGGLPSGQIAITGVKVGVTLTGNVVIPSTITIGSTTYTVTQIGPSAFANQTQLSKISIPSSVTTIGDSAFKFCSGLTSITIPSGVISIGSDAFAYCNGLTSIAIPASVTTIGRNAFYHSSKVTNITLPSSVTNIGDAVFHNSTYVTWQGNFEFKASNLIKYIGSQISYTIPGFITEIGEGAFANSQCNDITVSENIQTINENAFKGAKLRNVYFAQRNKYLNVKGSVFEDCVNLKSITLPKTLSTISASMFSGCSSLETVYFESGSDVIHIGFMAFMNCGSLKSIEIPEKVLTIAHSAFENCTSLTNIIIRTNSIWLIGNAAFANCRSLTSITIPSSVTYIGIWAFADCVNLAGVTFINSQIKEINDYTFYNCASLTNITIPNNVTRIGRGAFADCVKLENLLLPIGLKEIGIAAFLNMNRLNNIIIPEAVITIGQWAFADCANLTIKTMVKSKPNGWDNEWNSSNRPVVWA